MLNRLKEVIKIDTKGSEPLLRDRGNRPRTGKGRDGDNDADRKESLLPKGVTEELAELFGNGRDRVSKCDVVAGGFPCQDISVAGKGAGIEGERSSLWFEMLETIRMVRPRYVLVENVAAISFRGLGEILRDLAEAGYDAEWFTIRASDFEAPHKRERLFVVAYTEHNGYIATTGQQKIKGMEQCKGWPQEPSRTIKLEGGSPRPNLPKNVPNAMFGGLETALEQFKCKNMGKRGPWERDPAEEDPTTESFVGRVAYGIPDRVDRIKALGNAVVPQVAEFIGRRIMEYERQRE